MNRFFSFLFSQQYCCNVDNIFATIRRTIVNKCTTKNINGLLSYICTIQVSRKFVRKKSIKKRVWEWQKQTDVQVQSTNQKQSFYYDCQKNLGTTIVAKVRYGTGTGTGTGTDSGILWIPFFFVQIRFNFRYLFNFFRSEFVQNSWFYDVTKDVFLLIL